MGKWGQPVDGYLYIAPKPVRLMAAGAIAGTVTKTLTAPLDRIKVLLQVQAMGGQSKYSGIVGSTRQILAEEGFLAMWRGNFANCARIVPVYASRFAFNDLIKDAIKEPGQDPNKLRPAQSMLSGTLAGFAQQYVPPHSTQVIQGCF